MLTRLWLQAKVPCHMYNLWLVSCSFSLSSKLLTNIFCLSRSMKLAPEPSSPILAVSLFCQCLCLGCQSEAIQPATACNWTHLPIPILIYLYMLFTHFFFATILELTFLHFLHHLFRILSVILVSHVREQHQCIESLHSIFKYLPWN